MRATSFLVMAAAGLAACNGGGTTAASSTSTSTTTSAASASASASAPSTAPASTSTSAPAAGEAVLTPETWGRLRIAMSEAQALEVLGAGWRPDEGSGEPAACHFLRSGAVSPVVVMIENGRVTRVTAQAVEGSAATVRTDRGVGVGSTEAQVRAAYQGLQEEADRYDPHARSLYFWSVGGGAPGEYVQNETARGLRFEIGQGGRVTAIHAGGPSIQLAEGCS